MIVVGTIGVVLGGVAGVLLAPKSGEETRKDIVKNIKEMTKPNVSTLGVLDIVNMTPWNISLGNPPINTQMMNGMTTAAWYSMWLAGFNKPGANSNNYGGTYAFHSVQVALNNLNNAWVLNNSIPSNTNTYLQPVYYDTMPIVFNSTSFTQGAKTVALNFTATSCLGFSGWNIAPANSSASAFPATALSFGDGVNSYGWESKSVSGGYDGGNITKNASQFLTIQASQGSAWKPITQKLGGVVGNQGAGGSAPGTVVQSPNLLTVAGLVYPNFSAVAGDSGKFDLVVILQAGGYGDMQLLFLAVPNGNNSFLAGSTAGAVRR